MQVLQAAFLGYSTQSAHDDEFRIVYEVHEEVQDADCALGSDRHLRRSGCLENFVSTVYKSADVDVEWLMAFKLDANHWRFR
ncbi:hypothetical protein HFN89_00135 [Rhizobium laguerreae]|nr:hypothetical protein [Rhizobium laguerreae]